MAATGEEGAQAAGKRVLLSWRGQRPPPAACRSRSLVALSRSRKAAPRDFRRYIVFEKPKAPAKDQVQERVPQRTMIASWGMANDVEYDQVKNVFQEVGEILGIYLGSSQHLAIVDFSTEQAAESALYHHLMGHDLMGRPLKLTWFDPKDYAILRDIPTRGERMPSYLMQTIRHALEEIFANNHMKELITPVNSDGTSTGKAYIRYDVVSRYNAALNCDGVSELGGRILCHKMA